MESEILYNSQQIAEFVTTQAQKIDQWYSPVGVCSEERPLLAIAVLRGAFIFAADLTRQLKTPVEIDFIRASSYGNELHSSKTVTIGHSQNINMERRHVLLIEDIVDSGWTVSKLQEYCLHNNASSVKIVSLIDKSVRREVDIAIDFPGLIAPDRFLFGYGMDIAGRQRNLPDIWMKCN